MSDKQMDYIEHEAMMTAIEAITDKIEELEASINENTELTRLHARKINTRIFSLVGDVRTLFNSNTSRLDELKKNLDTHKALAHAQEHIIAHLREHQTLKSVLKEAISAMEMENMVDLGLLEKLEAKQASEGNRSDFYRCWKCDREVHKGLNCICGAGKEQSEDEMLNEDYEEWQIQHPYKKSVCEAQLAKLLDEFIKDLNYIDGILKYNEIVYKWQKRREGLDG